MAAAEIQVVNPSNLAKIESFLNDPSYKEIIENSSTFNTRLCAERRMRMPFIDTQTGVAQSHSNLFMTRKQRMPGAREGQVYTYPAQRWRKTKRQYMTMSSTKWGWSAADSAENIGEGENSCGVPEGLAGDDSRDGSQTAAKDDPKEWFYDELAMEEMETGEEPDPESDEDYYDDTYANRRKRRGGSTPSGPGSRGGRSRRPNADDTPAKRGRAGRGRKRAGQGSLPYEVPGDAEKPFGCERLLPRSAPPPPSPPRPRPRPTAPGAPEWHHDVCGAKYKTRPGLTYHFTHTHKEPAAGSDNDSRDSRPPASPPPAATPAAPTAPAAPAPPPPPATEYQDSYVTFLNNPAPSGSVAAAVVRRPSPPPRPASADTSSSDSAHVPLAAAAAAAAAAATAAAAAAAAAATAAAASAAPPTAPMTAADLKEPATKASPSPYCDFCLGDDRENKKTGTAEELVSCSDCGRSGHPTCLQFTANMIVSVRKYRWQCIECKCCSLCGTSDNDDQLLFCDDCDRGYHMYCLQPPLPAPPEGSWSCALCLDEFH